MIKLTCPKCGKHLRAPDNSEGRNGKCPSCRFAVAVPSLRDGSRDNQQSDATKHSVPQEKREPLDSPGGDDEEVGISVVVEVGEGEDFFSKSEEADDALESCPPPLECDKCGENSWKFISRSPRGKSATWECSYCGKKVIARSDHAKAMGSGGSRESISKDVQREVWRRDQGCCVDCGSRERLEYDHIIPVSRGGSSTVRNVQLLCETCNRKKSDKI